jgi:MFS superfamily sulfate permease-like transporter
MKERDHPPGPGWLARWVPAASWLPRYQRGWLAGDAISGSRSGACALSLVTFIALTPLFTDLPEAVLAALIIHAVSHLMKVGEIRRFRRLVPREFWLAM